MSQPAHRLREPRHERDALQPPRPLVPAPPSLPAGSPLPMIPRAASGRPTTTLPTLDSGMAPAPPTGSSAPRPLPISPAAIRALPVPTPDPRDPAPFESSAILAAATRLVGVRLWPAPITPPRDPKSRKRPVFVDPPNANDDPAPRCLVGPIVYPEGHTPDLALSPCRNCRRLHFDAACLLGLYTRMCDRLATPHTHLPPIPLLLSTELAIIALLHQFVIALLGLPRDYLPSHICVYSCPCNALRARYTKPPSLATMPSSDGAKARTQGSREQYSAPD